MNVKVELDKTIADVHALLSDFAVCLRLLSERYSDDDHLTKLLLEIQCNTETIQGWTELLSETALPGGENEILLTRQLERIRENLLDVRQKSREIIGESTIAEVPCRKSSLANTDSENTPVLILAGGNGDRLRPLTNLRPKPAVSFGMGFRIIDFTLSNCLNSGFLQIFILTQHRYEDVRNCVQNDWRELWRNREKGARSPLVFLPPADGKTYLGTADAVFQNRHHLHSDDQESILILSSDHIYHMDYRHLLRQHAESGADLTIACVEHPIRRASHFGVIDVDSNFKAIGFEEKPANPRPAPWSAANALVSMGVYAFRKKALLDALREFCREGAACDFGRHVVPWFVRSGNTSIYNFRDEDGNACYWRDIGTVDSYYEASMDLIQVHPLFNAYANALWFSLLSNRALSDELLKHGANGNRSGQSIFARNVLSPGVEIGEDVDIDQSVLLPGVRIGRGARLRRTIVDEGVCIPPGYEVGLDLEHDRRIHTVTDSGIVVVSGTPKQPKPSVVHFAVRGARVAAAPSMERNRPAPLAI